MSEAMGAEYVPSHRDVEADPRFNSKLATKFINCLMLDGKKSVATQVFYEALEIIGKRMTDVEPYTVFTVGLENVKPHIEVRSKRVGEPRTKSQLRSIHGDVRHSASAGCLKQSEEKRAGRQHKVWLMN